MSKFIFDGPNKKIRMNASYVVDGVITFSCLELWSRWVDWQAENPQYPFALQIIYAPNPAGGFIGPYLFLRNDLGWVGVPPEYDGCSIVITGGAFYGMSNVLPVMENVVGQETDLVVQQSNIVNTISTSGTTGPSAAEIAAATVAAMTSRLIDNGLTNDDMMRLMASVLLGKVSGTDTSTIKFRDLADTTDRITATVDASGNRTAITYDLQ